MRRTALVLVCGLGLIVAARATAAGGPAPPSQGGPGVTAPGIRFTYVALGTGKSTIVERVGRTNGSVEAYRAFSGNLGVAGAGYDGSNTGLSADGRRLVLVDVGNVYPSARTRLVVLNARRLRISYRIVLRGFFTVDAISPTGRWLYLIHYRSPSDINHYEVRAYDLVKERLLVNPVVDPREPDEKMQGMPITRTVSPDGRWAYTLYYRVNEAPFIHALDTATRTAYCVDVPSALGNDAFSLGLVLAPGSTLRVVGGGTTLAVIDTLTFAVRVTGAARASRGPSHAARQHAGGFPWPVTVCLLVVLFALLSLAWRRRSVISRGAVAGSPVTTATQAKAEGRRHAARPSITP